MRHQEISDRFRDWISRRDPFTIGVVFGLMLPGYMVHGIVTGWWRGWTNAAREWRHDRYFMVRWSMARRAARSEGAAP